MKFYTLKQNRARLAFVMLNVVLFLFLLGDISFSFYKQLFLESNNYLNLLSSQINFTKSINTYSDVVRDEIQIYKNINIKNYEDNLNLEFKNIANGISEYQVKEMNEVLNKMYQINRSIIGHLNDQEIQLAQKLFKTEFIFYKTKLISLLDSNKKLTILKFQNHFEDIINLSPLLKFKFVILFISFLVTTGGCVYFYSKLVNNNSMYLSISNELNMKDYEIIALKEVKQLVEKSNINLKENIFNIKRNLIELKDNFAGFEFNDAYLINEDVLVDSVNHIEKAYSSNEKLINKELDLGNSFLKEINLYNQKINTINSLTKTLKNSLVNYEINNKPLDLIIVKNLINELNSLNTIEIKDVSRNISFEELKNTTKQFRKEVNKFVLENSELIKTFNILNKKNENRINELHRSISNLEFEIISIGGRTSEKFI